MRIGINAFGRIGRNFAKALLERHPDVEIAAVNDLTSAAECAHLFKYDSNYGTYAGDVKTTADGITIDGKAIRVLAERDPGKLPWKDLGPDVVIESTGLFTDAAKARAHIDGGGAKKVIISAPAKGEDITLVLGVNDAAYDPAQHHVISNASCTTNCLATAVKPIVDTIGWVKGFMCTIHSYTNDQNILDAPHKDLRRARNAATNIIPTSTGAAKALYLTIPEVQGTFDGFALRVPTPTVSMIYLVAQTKKATTRDEVNAILRGAAENGLKDYVQYTEEELVSSDFKKNPSSSIVDGQMTHAQGDLIQIAAWYDNEWGYSCRLADLTRMVASMIPSGVALASRCTSFSPSPSPPSRRRLACSPRRPHDRSGSTTCASWSASARRRSPPTASAPSSSSAGSTGTATSTCATSTSSTSRRARAAC